MLKRLAAVTLIGAAAMVTNAVSTNAGSLPAVTQIGNFNARAILDVTQVEGGHIMEYIYYGDCPTGTWMDPDCIPASN